MWVLFHVNQKKCSQNCITCQFYDPRNANFENLLWSGKWSLAFSNPAFCSAWLPTQAKIVGSFGHHQCRAGKLSQYKSWYVKLEILASKPGLVNFALLILSLFCSTFCTFKIVQGYLCTEPILAENDIFPGHYNQTRCGRDNSVGLSIWMTLLHDCSTTHCLLPQENGTGIWGNCCRVGVHFPAAWGTEDHYQRKR